MKEVPEDEFFDKMKPLDVHPCVRIPDRTDWKLRDGTLVGMSLPGWKNPWETKRYFLA
jgi:hypothetical protein